MQSQKVNLSLSQSLVAEDASQNCLDQNQKVEGRWEQDQHHRFLQGLFKFGKNWKEIQNLVSTRICSQVRSHAQKYFIKLQKIIKDRKKQKNKYHPEVTDIQRQIVERFTPEDITPNTPEILANLIRNSRLVPNSKAVEKSSVSSQQQKQVKKKGFQRITPDKALKNSQIKKDQIISFNFQNDPELPEQLNKIESIVDLYNDQDQSKSFFCRVIQSNVEHFRQGKGFTQFIDFDVKPHQEIVNPKVQDLDSLESTRNRRASFTLVEDQQNDIRLKVALQKIKNGDSSKKQN